jgi:hypothetical protein
MLAPRTYHLSALPVTFPFVCEVTNRAPSENLEISRDGLVSKAEIAPEEAFSSVSCGTTSDLEGRAVSNADIERYRNFFVVKAPSQALNNLKSENSDSRPDLNRDRRC